MPPQEEGPIVSSPISLSNFNSIDFSVILNAVMAQNSQPLTALQAQQTGLAAENNNYNLLATKLGSLETAAAGLSTASGVTAYSSTLSDTGSIAVTANGDGVPGTYDVVVSHLAKAQVSASSSTAPDANTASVGNSGTLTIGGVDVMVTGAVTLTGLATQINATANMAVMASVVQSAPDKYRLVLTSKDTGLANGFTVTGSLSGGTGMSFTDPTAQDALDAEVTVNGVQIKSSSNTLASAIPGSTLSLLHADSTKTTTVSVAADDSALANNVGSFVSAYNDVIAFMTDQSTQAAGGQTGTLAHEALLRQARSALRSALGATYGSGTFPHLAEVGIGFNQTGQLTLNKAALSAAVTQDRASVVALFAGTTTGSSGFTNGAFGTVQSALDDFTHAGGFVSAAQVQLTAEGSRLDSQISDMQSRLAIQRKTLQAQYTAADAAMTQLKSQSGTLASTSTSGLVTN
jgi:flagellar hook-associated protein 2